MLQGYSLSQQPDAEHLSILRRECHGPDVAHRLLYGTWLRSASHNRQSPASPQRPASASSLWCAGAALTMRCNALLPKRAKLVLYLPHVPLKRVIVLEGLVLNRHMVLIQNKPALVPINARRYYGATYPEHEIVLDFRLDRGVVHMKRRQRL